MRARLRCLALPLLLGAAGCAHQVVVDPPAAPPRATLARLPVAGVVESIVSARTGNPYHVNLPFKDRLVMELRGSGRFASVFSWENADQAPREAVRLRFEVRETIDRHWTANVFRAIAVGMSLLLLTPVMTFETGYAVELTAEALTCDGWTTQYAGRASGELTYKLLFDEPEAYGQLAGQVTERALALTLDQIVRDEALPAHLAALGENGCAAQEPGR
jgi:hypothetical protein